MKVFVEFFSSLKCRLSLSYSLEVKGILRQSVHYIKSDNKPDLDNKLHN